MRGSVRPRFIMHPAFRRHTGIKSRSSSISGIRPRKFLFYLGLWLLLLASCQMEHPPQKTLNSVAQISHLTPTQLQQGYAVELDGVVTFYDDRWHLLVLQDSTGGIAVDIRSPLEGIKRGDHVIVQGYTAYEGYVSIVVKPRLTRLGSANLPAAPMADLNLLFQGALDYRLIQIDCHVRAPRSVGLYRIELAVEADGHSILVYGSDYIRGVMDPSAGQDIHLRGVPVMVYDPFGKRHSLRIYFSGNDDIQLRDPSLSTMGSPSLAPSAESASLPLLTSVEAIKSLSVTEADKGYPVRVRATITHWNPDRYNVIVQDEKAGIYLDLPKQHDTRLGLGSRVEVQGTTKFGSFAPMIEQGRLTYLGEGALPTPLKLLPSEGFSGREENIWSEVEGVVHSVTPDTYGGVQMQAVSGGTRLLVLMLSRPNDNLVDSRVRMQGVFGPIYSGDRWLTGFVLYVPSMEFVKVLDSSAGDTLQSPSHSIHSLLEYSPKGFSWHRLKVEGQVTYVGGDGTIYLADQTGGVRLTGNLAGKLELNSPVQALGFFRPSMDRPTLEDTAVFLGKGTPTVSPIKITAESALSGSYDGHLIEVQGFLREVHRAFGDWIFTVGSGRSQFSAVLEYPQAIPGSEALREGAMVQFTGICVNGWNTSVVPPSPTDFRLLLRTTQDLVVLQKASWWTLRRAMLVVGTLGGVLLLATAWLALLRRQVSAQTVLLRKQMEQREQLESQLRQSQKLESVGRLAGGIAHDFNNLLTVINGYSEFVMSELPPSSELVQSVAEIKKAGGKAALLTGQLLAFSRKQILQPVVMDLNGLVDEMDNMLRRLIGEDIALVTLLSPEPCRVLADPGQLSQVLMNLAANARDAMPEGGKLVIETANVTIDAGLAEKHVEVLPGEYVRLAVNDCGAGMDADTVARLFEPFFTTKGLGRGTGLGLSTVFGIIKQSGGHIWVYSEPGQGTTFKIHLPRATGEETPFSALKGKRTSAGHETILIVEDQAEVRALIVKSLSAQGYQVLESSNGDEALAIVAKHAGPIHLLLTDVVMPGISGKVLAERLLDLRPGILVLYMSGYTENVVAHKGVLDAGIEYLQKPFSPATLSSRVREVLEKNKPINPAIGS